MKKASYIILIFTSIFLLNACREEEIQEKPQIPDPSVQLLDLSEPPSYQINEVGTIKAIQEVELISKANGTIGKLSMKLGDNVSAGQTLAVIDFDESNNPAKVNYDNAKLQLSNARQNYDEVIANNQDAVTQARLRVEGLETTLTRLQRNLDELKSTNNSRRMTLELQLENAQKNADTAEINYQSALAQLDQSWADLLNSTKTSLDGTLVNLESNFFSLRGILNPDNRDLLRVQDLQSGLGTRNSRQRLDLLSEFNTFQNSMDSIRLSYDEHFPLTENNTDAAIYFMHDKINEFKLLLTQSKIMLENSSTSVDGLSEAALASYKTSVATIEGLTIADSAVLNGLDQVLQSFKIDRTSQTITADNNRVIANNQLVDAQNALNNFETTSLGAIRDLESQIEQTSDNLLAAQTDLDSIRRTADIQKSTKNLEINTLSNQVRLAEKALSDNRITASIDGTISELAVDEGDYVSMGTYLGKIIQSEEIKVIFYVSESNAQRLKVGQPFKFTTSGQIDREFKGFVRKISPSADPINKKIRIEGSVKNDELLLKPEMFINLNLDITSQTFDRSKIYIPLNSIIFAQNEHYVYVVEEGMGEDEAVYKAMRRNIQIGAIFGMWVEVLDGLDKNDQLIVEGHRNLPSAGGVEVNVVE